MLNVMISKEYKYLRTLTWICSKHRPEIKQVAQELFVQEVAGYILAQALSPCPQLPEMWVTCVMAHSRAR